MGPDPVLALGCGVALGFLVVPILALVPMSFSGTRWLALPPTDLSLRWYRGYLTDRDWLEATLVSLEVATAAMAVAAVLGTLGGAALARTRFAGRDVVRALLLSPLVVPVIILAIASYALFGRLGWVGTIPALVLAHAVLGVPYVVLNVEAVMRAFDVRLERAARMLGATALQAFAKVTLPLVRPGVLAGALFAFIVSLDEVVVAMFLSGTSAITLPKLMWDSITQDELNPVVAAVASLQIGMALAVFAGTEALRARGARLALAAGPAVDPAEGAGRGPAGGAAAPAGREPATGRLGVARLRLVGVEKRFGPVVAVAPTSLDVEPGEFLTLLGPSGSGKTTILNMVAGFETPSGGEVFLGAAPLGGLPPNRRNIGMVFQDYALFPHLSVFENVAFPLRLRGVPEADVRRRVGDILEIVRLPALGGRMPRQLSGGQQQRVALARALVFRPPLLLMDEPLGALDRNLRESMQGEIRSLHRRFGITILFVTHDQEEAMALSDRIAVIDHGVLQQVGRPEALYEAPANAFVATFLGESNLLPCTVAAEEVGGLRVVSEGGSPFLVGRRGPAPGATGRLLLRPESLRLGSGGTVGRAAVPGVVEEVVYLGGVRRYTVRINARETLVVRVPRQAGAADLGAGSLVEVGWEPADLRLL